MMPENPQFTADVLKDIRQLFEFTFMVNAFRAGTIVAVTAALMGWFVVLRRQTFAAHTLALVGFPGAAGAILLGIAAPYGYFASALGASLLMAALPAGRRGYSQESAVVGTVQAFALALGFLFFSLTRRNITGAQALLFGSFLGITTDQVVALLVGAVAVLLVLAYIGRPLLFASIDPDVAAARGVPVNMLSVVFLLLLGLAAAEASQITGSLLVFALLVLPAATAEKLTPNPAKSILATVVIAVFTTWLSLAASYYSNYPIGFFITSVAFAAYLVASGWQMLGPQRRVTG